MQFNLIRYLLSQLSYIVVPRARYHRALHQNLQRMTPYCKSISDAKRQLPLWPRYEVGYGFLYGDCCYEIHI